MTRSEWQRSVHESLRREIEQFAGRFFGLDPRSRENEWRALHDRAKDFPRLQGRLERLQPGLAIPSQIPPGASPEVERHIRGLMAVFVASPTKRHEAIREAGFDLPRPQMRKLARFVRRTLPEFATLEPALVDRLTRDEPARTGPEITVSTSSGVTGPRSDSQNYLPVALFISLAILFFRAVSAFSPANRAEERPTAIAAPPFSSPERLPGYRTAESARETSQRLEKWQQEQRRERQALQQRRLDELKKRTSPQRKAVDTEAPAIAEIPEPPRKDPHAAIRS